MARFRRILQVASILAAGGLLLVGTLPGQEAEKQTLEGIIGDMACGTKHNGGIKHNFRNLSDVECTKVCIKVRFKYALVVGNVKYELEGNTAGLDEMAGQKAKVTGIVTGNKIQVESATKAS